MEIKQEETDRVLRNIEEAINAIEEKGRADVKLGLPKWTGEMKYKWVADYIGNKFPTLSKIEADKKINAVLGKLRCSDKLCDPPLIIPTIKQDLVISNEIPPQVGSGV